MSEQTSHQVEITFSDVAAYFYEEEWELLEAWQKDLYKNVMKEIHTALISMGYTIVNPHIFFRIKDGAEPNHHVSEKRKRLHSAKSCSQNVKPDILLRIKQAKDVCIQNPPDSEGGKHKHVPTASDPVFNPDMSIWIKQVEEPYFSNRKVEERRHTNPHVVARPVVVPDRGFYMKPEKVPFHRAQTSQGRQSSTHNPPTKVKVTNADLSMCIKQEEESCPMDVQTSQRVEIFHCPPAVKITNADLSMCIKQEEQSYPVEVQTSQRVEMFHCPPAVPGARPPQKLGNELPAIHEKEAKNTQVVIKTSLSIFKDYLRARNLDFRQVEHYDRDQLNRLLCTFYAGVRKPNGDYYAKKSIISFRYGLQKHFGQLSGFDIMHDPAFRDANTTMAAMFVRLKSEGLADVQHKEPLTREDFKKLYDGCDINTPAGLQHKVFIDLMLHLCNRGREKLREFNKDEFQIAVDAGGHKYVSARKNRRLSKNYQGELMENEQGPRMYELKGNPKCPVLSFEKYLMKLHPGHSAFWQRPKLAAPSNPSPWYSNAPVGKNTLGNYMKTLSQDYGLSRLYTNHCLRVTCSTALRDLCMLKSGL